MANITEFGTTAAGAVVQKITLSNADLRVAILSYGAILQSVHLTGVPYDLTLGSDQIADYEGAMMYHGSLVGPIVNRFTDATATLYGQTLSFEKNFLGKHSLHSGASGLQHKVWAIDAATNDTAQLSLTLADGEGGFPGQRHVTARFTLQDAALRMDVGVTTDKPTFWNVANHSYWNMDGTTNYDGHSLQIVADHFLPTTDEFVPTGEIRAVAGTDMDFNILRPIAPHSPDFDNNFCLGTEAGPLRTALVLQGQSGVTMTVSTTEAGIQVYDHRQLPLHGGGPYRALAIEAQNWPDSPNHPGFPSVVLEAGSLTQTTQWHFGKRT